MLEGQQSVRFHQLTTLRPFQILRVPHGLAEQEKPRAGGSPWIRLSFKFDCARPFRD